MSNPKTPPPQPPQQPPSPSQFNHSLAKISVAQILHTVGFTSASSAALDSLSRVTALFLRHLSSSSSSSSAASADSVPSFHDVVSAIDDLNFPLDFSIPQLSRFLSTSDHLPFPRLVPKPDFLPPQKPTSTAADDGVCRRAEVPSWLPAFPQIIKDSDGNIGSDFGDDDEKGINKEVYWEKRRCLSTKAVKETVKENHVVQKTKRGGKRSVVVCGRRERVKFKLGVRRKGDDLELKNGVCRGGKRICFVNRVVPDRFFKFDDDD